VSLRGVALLAFGAGLLALAGAGLWVRLFAGGPVLLFPGGPLRGELVREPIADWSFAASSQYMEVQARGRVLPYSRRCWLMVHEGRLYLLLPRLFGDGLERRIEASPDIRVRIGEKVHPVRARRHEADYAVLLAPVLRRTMSLEIGGTARPVASPARHGGIAIFLLESQPPSASPPG
jgi:hypothetical protein